MPAFNDIGWFEIGAADPAGAEKFYGEVFGWTAQPAEEVAPGYRIVSTVEDGMHGGIAAAADRPGYAVFAVRVADVEETLRRVVAAGGSVARDPATTTAGLTFAHLRDPEGNEVSVFTPPTRG